jgi:hypothetical protein
MKEKRKYPIRESKFKESVGRGRKGLGTTIHRAISNDLVINCHHSPLKGKIERRATRYCHYISLKELLCYVLLVI